MNLLILITALFALGCSTFSNRNPAADTSITASYNCYLDQDLTSKADLPIRREGGKFWFVDEKRKEMTEVADRHLVLIDDQNGTLKIEHSFSGRALYCIKAIAGEF